MIEIKLAEPRGFCAGVDRAIEIVDRAIEVYGAPVYVRHEIVHNKYVVESLRAKGAVFVEDLDEVPDGAILIFSAHGVSQTVRQTASRRGFRVIDATCPLVTKVHMELWRHYQQGEQIVLIGHAGHPEVEGTMGQAPAGSVLLISEPGDVDRLEVKDPDRLAFVTQTTLSVDDTAAVVDALKSRFPNIRGPRREDICYATSNRQAAVKSLAAACDLVLVIGSRNSSNSNRLREVAERAGCEAYLIDGKDSIDPTWIKKNARIGITAGASAPETLVQELIEFLRAHGAGTVESLSVVKEKVSFGLPEGLKQKESRQD